MPPDEVLVALIGLTGAVLGPLVTGFVSRSQQTQTSPSGNTVPSSSQLFSRLLLAILAGGIVGAVLGYIIVTWGIGSDPRVVRREATGDGVSQSYSASLSRDEVIVGEAFKFDGDDNNGRGCIVFQILANGPVTFDITSGGWRQHASVDDPAGAERLFQGTKQQLLANGPANCTSDKIVEKRVVK